MWNERDSLNNLNVLYVSTEALDGDTRRNVYDYLIGALAGTVTPTEWHELVQRALASAGVGA